MKTPQIRSLGKVNHLSESSLIIVKGAEFIPPYGAKVVSETIEEIGTIHRILGPIKQPFIGIKVTCDKPQKLIGKKLFVIKEKRSKKRGKRGRKRREDEKVKPSDD
ncbi:MAG: H/ACA ribonucleoprotein complex subunit GAR1 [Candidatus Kariarchaeaceae archaeon]